MLQWRYVPFFFVLIASIIIPDMKLAPQFLTFFFLLQKGYHELSGMVAAARQACAHPSLIDLGREHSRKVAELNRDRRKEENKQKKKGSKALAATGAVTRESIRQLACEKSRNAAKARMRNALDRYQQGDLELLECPVCFETVGETEIALPACAHPTCTQCAWSLLGAASDDATDATGHCPTCRDLMKRSEITFLGDAVDSGAAPEISEKDGRNALRAQTATKLP